MKNIFLFVIMSGAVLTSCAQTKCHLKKAYAFYTVSIPGVQMADENGNPVPPKPYMERFIYIEWSGSKNPEIETVLYNSKPMAVTLAAVDGTSVSPGEDTGNNKDYKITSKKCNNLWKLQLQPPSGNEMPAQNCNNIVIKIKGGDIACEFKLAKETELATFLRY